MADRKISELLDGTTPLDGTELVEIVQGGDNVKVPASAFSQATATACVRFDSAGAITASNGVDSVTDNGGGNYRINFTVGRFATAPVVVGNANLESEVQSRFMAIGDTNEFYVDVRIYEHTGSPVACGGLVIAMAASPP